MLSLRFSFELSMVQPYAFGLFFDGGRERGEFVDSNHTRCRLHVHPKVPLELVASEWLLCLCCGPDFLPIQTVLRVWDWFLLDGPDVLL
jgi:hypothetical protein